MPEDNEAYKKIMERLDHIENRIDQFSNKMEAQYKDLSDKMDENYRELKRNYRTLNARLSVLEKKLGHYFSEDEIYGVEVRFAERGFDSATEPTYEKFDDFGPDPVPRKRYA